MAIELSPFRLLVVVVADPYRPLILVSAHECHLCERAREVLSSLGVRAREIAVGSDDDCVGASLWNVHHWAMVACCVPMLSLAVGLLAAGVVSPAFMVGAVVCALMMALMMGGMHRSGGR